MTRSPAETKHVAGREPSVGTPMRAQATCNTHVYGAVPSSSATCPVPMKPTRVRSRRGLGSAMLGWPLRLCQHQPQLRRAYLCALLTTAAQFATVFFFSGSSSDVGSAIARQWAMGTTARQLRPDDRQCAVPACACARARSRRQHAATRVHDRGRRCCAGVAEEHCFRAAQLQPPGGPAVCDRKWPHH